MSSPSSIPHLCEQTLGSLSISTHEMIQTIEDLILGSRQNRVWAAPKSVLLPDDGRYLMSTLAACDDPPLLAVKSLVLNPENPEKGIPQINGVVTLLNSHTGLPVATVDGNWITAVRTAALSALAAKRMANPNSSVAALIGTGVQARSHLNAFAELFPLKRIKVLGRGGKNIDRLGRLAHSKKIEADVCSNGREAIEEADLIVSSITFSASLEPFLDASEMKNGAFASITDLGTPWKKESYSAFDRLMIDDLQQESAQPNKLCDPVLITGDLHQLVSGEVSGRRRASDRTAFLFRGHALGDLALAVLAVQHANTPLGYSERVGLIGRAPHYGVTGGNRLDWPPLDFWFPIRLLGGTRVPS